MSPDGYNLTHGGEGGSPSEETRAKISAANKGRLPSEAKKGKPPWNKGKSLSVEHRQKIADAHRRRIAKLREGKSVGEKKGLSLSESSPLQLYLFEG